MTPSFGVRRQNTSFYVKFYPLILTSLRHPRTRINTGISGISDALTCPVVRGGLIDMDSVSMQKSEKTTHGQKEVPWDVAKDYILDKLNEFMFQYF